MTVARNPVRRELIAYSGRAGPGQGKQPCVRSHLRWVSSAEVWLRSGGLFFAVVSKVLHHFYIIKNETVEMAWNSLTQNESHKRQCSLFSIERQFPKLDVAGSIPVSRVSDRTDLCWGAMVLKAAQPFPVLS